MIQQRVFNSVARRIAKLSMIGLPKGPHLTRYYMYTVLSSVPVEGKTRSKVLSISRSKKLCEVMSLDTSEIIEANYPNHNILALDFLDGQFDFVVCDQVLEHVEGNPQRAVDEIHRVLKPGGVAVLTTCFLNPIHNDPGDFWRFTPSALKMLFGNFSQIIEVGGWGNRLACLLLELGFRFVNIPHSRWHPLYKVATLNSHNYPIVSWIVASK